MYCPKHCSRSLRGQLRKGIFTRHLKYECEVPKTDCTETCFP